MEKFQCNFALGRSGFLTEVSNEIGEHQKITLYALETHLKKFRRAKRMQRCMQR
jgi:hypothetical protein